MVATATKQYACKTIRKVCFGTVVDALYKLVSLKHHLIKVAKKNFSYKHKLIFLRLLRYLYTTQPTTTSLSDLVLGFYWYYTASIDICINSNQPMFCIWLILSRSICYRVI